jgi:glucose/arabinose dehydrogenase
MLREPRADSAALEFDQLGGRRAEGIAVESGGNQDTSAHPRRSASRRRVALFAVPVMLAVVGALVVTSQAVRAAPALTMTLTASPSPVHSGQTLTYTIKATNSGGSTLTSLNLADTVNSLGGSSYTITKSLGSCAQQGAQVMCTTSSLGAGQSWTVTIAGPVTAAAGTTLNNTASASGSQSGQTAIAGSSVATLVDLPQGFTQTVVAQMHNPTVIAFAPNGDLWVGEQAGQIRVVHNGTLQTNPVVTLQADGTSERGLLGLVFDPGFSSTNGGNGFIYVSYTTSADVTQVSRFTVVNGTANLNTEKILIKGDQKQGTFGPGNTLKLGPDGKLWWSVGGNPYPWDNAQSLATIYGKIHRINLDGSVPSDNPFVNVPHALPSIWAYGLRNPFRFTFLPNSGDVMVQDTGSSYWEEIDHIQPGSNYGWDLAEGNCFSCGYVNPVFSYGHLPIDGAASAVLAYNGSTFPSSYKNVVFFGDYNRRDIEAVTFDPTYHTPVSDYVFNANAGTISDLEQGPDGNLYFTSIFESKVQKISATGPFAPIAAASATPNSGAVANVPVQFSSNGSTDAFGNTSTLSYSWNFGDGSTNTSANPQHAYASNGSYVATLTVTASGKSTSASATVMVGRTTTASITAPATYNGGDTINFSGSAIDSVDGALPAGAYTWQADFISNGVAEPFYLHENPHPFFGPKSGVTSGSFTIPTDVSNSGGTLYRITLTVVNSAGVPTVVTQDINPNPASMTVNTNNCQNGSSVPLSGAAYVADGAWQTASTTQGVAGVQHVFMGAPDQVIGGQPYRFLGWNGCTGGALVNSFTNPAGAATYNATYEAVQAAPSPWQSTDVGTPMPGSTDYAPGSQSFYLDGSGADASGSTDQFHYTYQTLNGNGSIVARVRYQTTPNPSVKAGVMIKSSPTAGSAFVSALVTPDVSQNTPNLNGINCVFPSNAVGAGCDAPLPAAVPSVGQGVIMQYSGGSKSVTSASALANFKSPNKWLKLQRSGNTFTASYSSDGTNWTQISSTSVSMGNSVTIGMFVTAKDVREYSTAAFDSVSLNGSGGPANDFSISANPNSVTVAPGSSGTTSINTAVTNGASQSVVLSASGLPTGASASFNPPSVTSGGSSTMTITTATTTPTGTSTVTVTGTGTSATHSTPVTLVVGSSSSGCPTSWNCADIGNPAPAGSESLSSGTWNIQGGGSDIFGGADSFHYDWQSGTGNISAHMTAQSNTNAWAKAGIMVRADTSAGSVQFSVLVTPGNGIFVEYRTTSGGNTTRTTAMSGTVPRYLRITRSGSTFTGQMSTDNSSWTTLGSQTIAGLSGTVLEGLAVTSHANGTLCTVTMDTVSDS